MTRKDGRPRDDSFGAGSMLENFGDVTEALEECYGMIWVLANMLAEETLGHDPARADLLPVILGARDHYKDGVRLGKEIE